MITAEQNDRRRARCGSATRGFALRVSYFNPLISYSNPPISYFDPPMSYFWPKTSYFGPKISYFGVLTRCSELKM